MILAGIDFSDTAAHALRQARSLGERLERGVGVVHVREGYRADAAWAPSPGEIAWMEQAEVEPDEVLIRRGTPWVEVVRLAGEVDAEFIVVGTHGVTGFQPVQLGSTAARLALLSPRPVLLVGGRERGTTTRGVLRVAGARGQ